MMEREMSERRRMEEMQPRELEWEAREQRMDREPRPPGRSGKSRTSAKEREGAPRVEPQPRKKRVSAREEQRDHKKIERVELEQREMERR